ncbi:MAG: MFS transporter [Planctomycetota bacterium]
MLRARYAYIAFANGYSFGVIGPAVAQMSIDFSVGLAAVGFLSTAMYLVHAGMQLPSAGPIQRYGSLRVARWGFGAIVIANGLAAIAPGFGLLLASRLLVGVGTAPSFVGSMNAARQTGGAALAGLFGGLTLLASGSAILLGSALADADVSWRWNFVVAALLAIGAVLICPKDVPGAISTTASGVVEPMRAALATGRLWRLALLYAATFGTSFVLGAWIVEYIAPGASGKQIAGLVGFVILGASAGFRWYGGVLSDRGLSWNLLGPGATLVAATALGVFALTRSPLVAFPLAIVLGFGLALPFGAIFNAAVDAQRAHPAAAIAMVNMSASIFAMVVLPIVGYAFDEGAAWSMPAGLAAVAVIAALVNLRRVASRQATRRSDLE